MKKILLIINTELSAYQMLTYLKQNEKKYIVDLLIQNDHKNNFIEIFKPFLRKSFFFKSPPYPKFFSILRFWNIVYANRNKTIYKKTLNLLMRFISEAHSLQIKTLLTQLRFLNLKKS